jgi:AraC-like DNA-binding protein
VVLLASNIGDVFEVRVQTNSVIYYNQQFIKAFRAARLDSTRNWSGHPVWLATNRDWPGGLKLASTLANTGLLLRPAGHLPAAWLRELRLAQARRLLEAGEFTSVADVASATGFGSAKYFSVSYAERFGRRPNRLLLGEPLARPSCAVLAMRATYCSQPPPRAW